MAERKERDLICLQRKERKTAVLCAGVMSRDPGLMGIITVGPWLAKASLKKLFVPVSVSFGDSRF